MTGIIFITFFLIFIVIGVPISATIGISTLFALLSTGKINILYVIVLQLSEGVQKYSLLAIPFFILAANLMNETGITDKIFNFASNLVGHLRGGLAQVNVIASMVFAGVSGAAVADAAGLGIIEVKAMSEKGYPKSYTAAITLASSIVGPLIPPSIPLVIYAIISQLSVARLLLAGVVPGFITGGFLMIMNYIYSKKENFFPTPEKFPGWIKLIYSFKDSLLALLAPFIIVGSLVGGFVTATEAGLVTFAYALIIGFIYRGPRYIFKVLPKIFLDSAKTSGLLMYVLANATAMSWLMSREQIPLHLSKMILGFTNNPIVFLMIVIVLYLFLGTIIDGVTAMLISVPILLPIAINLGIDPVWFGIVTVYSLLLGMFTPPVGVGLFIMTKVADISFEDMVKSFLPFFIPLVAVLFILTFFPSVWIWLPNMILNNP